MTPEQEREAFEAWARSMGPAWEGTPMASQWVAWQARAALAQQDSVPEDARDGINGPHNACMFREHCRSMLAAAPQAEQRAEREPMSMVEEEEACRAFFKSLGWPDLKVSLAWQGYRLRALRDKGPYLSRIPAEREPPQNICDNCGEPAPGCSGLFASDGKACEFHGIGKEGT